jgi:uncharacterized OB-fold protein
VARAIRGEMPVGFHYTPGVGNGAFFEALRARGAFLGSRCDACERTYVPARIFCERCFAALGPGVECGPGGTLESFTIVHEDVDGEPVEPPAPVGLVRLDGADTVLVHRLLGDAEWAIGMRVEAELRPAEQRIGSILDVEGFRRD